MFLLVQLTAVRFDEQHELIWTGETGKVWHAWRRRPDAPDNKGPMKPDRDATMSHGTDPSPGCGAFQACMASTHTSTLLPPFSGCESGRLYNTHVPTLEPYARWPAHPPGSAVLELLPLHGCCLSLSQGRAAVHAAGGALRFTHDDAVGHGWQFVCVQMG